MLDHFPPAVVKILDGTLAWVYSFQPLVEPTVVLGALEKMRS
jgi:hypothetical protein